MQVGLPPPSYVNLQAYKVSVNLNNLVIFFTYLYMVFGSAIFYRFFIFFM